MYYIYNRNGRIVDTYYTVSRIINRYKDERRHIKVKELQHNLSGLGNSLTAIVVTGNCNDKPTEFISTDPDLKFHNYRIFFEYEGRDNHMNTTVKSTKSIYKTDTNILSFDEESALKILEVLYPHLKHDRYYKVHKIVEIIDHHETTRYDVLKSSGCFDGSGAVNKSKSKWY